MTEPTEERKVQTYCALCIARCGAIATVAGDRLVALDPDPSHPTGAALCAKGRAAPELVHSQDRLLYPMKRTRPKGDSNPGWQRISWDEALDTVAAAMRRIADAHRPEAVAFSLPSPSTTAIVDSGNWIRRLMNAFGTPNAANHIELCGWARNQATKFTFGVGSVHSGSGGAMADIANSGVLMLCGYNPSGSRITHATATAEALKRGMKLIVIDPRRAGFANKADVWLRVKPGTDGALALGLANVMIERGWYDRAFLRDWSNGPLLVRADTGRLLTERALTPDGSERRYVAWDEAGGGVVVYDPVKASYEREGATPALEGAWRIATAGGEVACETAFSLYSTLCRRYPAEVVAATCWIDRDQVEAAARLIWSARPVSYYAYAGQEHANTTQTARAMSLLYALTGSFDIKGGNVLFPSVPQATITGEDLPAAKTMRPTAGFETRPLGPARTGTIVTNAPYDAILDHKPYPIRGLIGWGSNLLVGRGNVRRGREALTALEFFVHADLFMTPTAEMADVVLPVASAFEREALRIGFEVNEDAQSLVQFRQAVVPPRGESRSDIEIVVALAQRLGLGDHFWNGDIAAGFRHQLAPSGLTLEALQAAPGGSRRRLRRSTRSMRSGTRPASPPASRRRRARWRYTARRCSRTAMPRCRNSSSPAQVSRPGRSWPHGIRWCSHVRSTRYSVTARTARFRACADACRIRRWNCTHRPPPNAASPPGTGSRSRLRRAASVRGRGSTPVSIRGLSPARTAGGRLVRTSACRATTRSARRGATSIFWSAPTRSTRSAARRPIAPEGERSVGAPLDLYDQPINTFVASFIGSPSMNLIAGTFVTDDRSVLRLADGAILPLAGSPQLPSGNSVIFGIRPEHVVIDEKSGVPAEIVTVEPTGSETHATAIIGKQQISCVFRTRFSIAPGDKAPLSFSHGPHHFFDPITTMRI